MEWISVKNGELPQEGKVYLVTYVTKGGKKYVRDLQCRYASETPRLIIWSKKIPGTVIAYMPLPEPYKGD